MGCSMSKLDNEEAVQLCKDRKKFIKQAVDQRLKFAAGHVAYMQAMRRVSAALREYIDGDEPREFSLDSFASPMKKMGGGFISIAPNSFSVTSIKSGTNSSYKLNFYKPSGTPSVSVEERPPPSPETCRVESYSPIHPFGMESMYISPTDSSLFHYSPDNRPNYPPSLPQTSRWDFFWNPFSSLDYYSYQNNSSVDQAMLDENEGLKQVRAEEGIPELEEETEFEDVDDREEGAVEDVDDSEASGCINEEIEREMCIQHKVSQEGENTKVMEAQSAGQMSKKEMAVSGSQSKDETWIHHLCKSKTDKYG